MTKFLLGIDLDALHTITLVDSAKWDMFTTTNPTCWAATAAVLVAVSVLRFPGFKRK